MSLRGRLILSAAYLLTVVVLALEIPLATTLQRFREGDVTSRIVSYTAITASAINDDLAAIEKPNPALPNPEEAIADLADFAADRSHARMVIVDANGNLIYDSAHRGTLGAPYIAGRPAFSEVLGHGQGALPDARRAPADPGGPVMQLVTTPVLHDRTVIGAVQGSVPLNDLRVGVLRSWVGLAAIGVAVIAVGLILAWVLARSIGQPVERLKRAAEDLGRGDMGARAPVAGPEEVASLSASFNRMADAMESNLAAQRDFVANASHQLRTPMTGIRLRLEAIQDEGGFAGEQASKAQAELTRLTSLVDDLLALAKATSSGGAAGGRVDVGAAAADAVGRWFDTAQDRGKRLELGRVMPSAALMDRKDLDHVLDNLIENGIFYVPDGGHITVEALTQRRHALVIVADDGPGIPEAERERVFERFFRGATGRSSGPGTGLGLAIVGELVRKWGGDVRLLEGPGARFEVRLPLAPDASRPGGSKHPAATAGPPSPAVPTGAQEETGGAPEGTARLGAPSPTVS
jgi:two-component system, OmpR family, sensor kinase